MSLPPAAVALPEAPPELRAQQRRLATLLTAPDGPDVADGASAVARTLRPLGGAAPRLSVYRTAYRARLVEALRENHPVLHRVLGDDGFEVLALAYVDARPSRHPSIRWYGHALADWMDALAADGDARVPHPALPDLARMEWAVGTAFDSADAVPVNAADLGATPPADWPALRFAPHPAVRRVVLGWSVEPLWRALTEDPDAEPPAPERLDHALLVWRPSQETRWRSVAADEDDALAACLDGLPFGALCARVAAHLAAAGEDPAGAAPRVAGWLRGWVEQGLLLLPMPASMSMPMPPRPQGPA